MRRMLPALLLCCAAVLLTAACGDDDKPPTGDSKVTPDTGPGADSSSGKDTGGTKKDATPPQDTTGKTWDGATNLACGEIGLCSEDCGKTVCTMAIKFGCLMTCQKDCKAKGCAAAQTLFQTLSDCITKNCMLDCINGPGPKCTTCTTTKCAKDTNTCNAHTC